MICFAEPNILCIKPKREEFRPRSPEEKNHRQVGSREGSTGHSRRGNSSGKDPKEEKGQRAEHSEDFLRDLALNYFLKFSSRLSVFSTVTPAKGLTMMLVLFRAASAQERDQLQAKYPKGHWSSCFFCSLKKSFVSLLNLSFSDPCYSTQKRSLNEDMFCFNAAVMDLLEDWMYEVLDCFDTIVLNAGNTSRLQEECLWDRS